MAVTSTGVFALTISSLGKEGIGRMLMYAVDSSGGIAGGNCLTCRNAVLSRMHADNAAF